MTQSIRVVVANRPRLMRELVIETISGYPDIEILAEIQNVDEIAGAVDGTHPDILIVELNEFSQPPAICDTLLRRYHEMGILALAPERNCSIFYYWGPVEIHERSVETSEAGILNALRYKSGSTRG
jgi:hypothetical protein